MFKLIFKSNQIKSFKSFSEMCAFCALTEEQMIKLIKGEIKHEAIKRVVIMI